MMTLRELLQTNPVLTILGIIIILFILQRIIKGKTRSPVKNIITQEPVQAVPETAQGDIIAAITAAVTEFRKKG